MLFNYCIVVYSNLFKVRYLLDFMVLYMIGLGLGNEKDVSVKGLEIIKKCNKVFLDNYTSVLHVGKEKLEEFYGKEIILADRDLVEKKSDEILIDGDVAFLVVGDVFSATTHTDLRLRALEKGIEVKVIPNASVLTAIGITGLELYKFGRVASLSFFVEKPESVFKIIKDNLNLGLHTLVLLDLDPKENKFMSIKEALEILDFNDETLVIGCARLGQDEVIKYGSVKELMDFDFGEGLKSLIIPGKLHFVEEEALEKWKI